MFQITMLAGRAPSLQGQINKDLLAYILHNGGFTLLKSKATTGPLWTVRHSDRTIGIVRKLS
jgi:hypothetical protein